QLGLEQSPRFVIGPLGDQAGLGPEPHGPRRHVRCLAACDDVCLRWSIVAQARLSLRASDHVEERVAERAQKHPRIVSWTATTKADGCARSCSAGSWGLPRLWPQLGGGSGAPGKRRRGWPPSRTRPATARLSKPSGAEPPPAGLARSAPASGRRPPR